MDYGDIDGGSGEPASDSDGGALLVTGGDGHGWRLIGASAVGDPIVSLVNAEQDLVRCTLSVRHLIARHAAILHLNQSSCGHVLVLTIPHDAKEYQQM